ncbi:hypothetical protein PUNSTDRAFT_116208 [Punctularia strigosozonata HHB-11173 SS5]|uniref:Integrase catalytic domain-containing protein n=1 Tax=Punctularia strigosozonata (strain HHB-11173) TaxID=741275 RepID=R7S5R4_PUNST|nr:uncharacterized protein PUNSTDRAFT_116208 [Punctularia strigosozonata HHB-11173 SS5]EIN04921.1 hypothetical protein PUNSTDRAFT_116208 [Punctularia strigosozonata HHB-11173 SS5]
MRKKHHVALQHLDPHHEWSGDGHDKLARISFPIWGIRDCWSGKWLGLWVVPNNRFKSLITYLYLWLVHELGGMPIQTTTDCSSETTEMYGFALALRTDNTTIEHGWLRLRLQWGDNVKEVWEKGRLIYDETNVNQFKLVQWLWPKLIQQELEDLKEKFNNHPVRKDHNKLNPSGDMPEMIMQLAVKEYSTTNCLQPIDHAIVENLMADLEVEKLLEFVDPAFAIRAEEAYNSLNITRLDFYNVWHIFQAILPIMFPT